MINLAIIGLGKWGETLVKSVNFKSKTVKFTSQYTNVQVTG